MRTTLGLVALLTLLAGRPVAAADSVKLFAVAAAAEAH